jgi:hypothetical protein
VLRIAVDQSNRNVAPEYLTTWQEVTDALRVGWAAWLQR